MRDMEAAKDRASASRECAWRLLGPGKIRRVWSKRGNGKWSRRMDRKWNCDMCNDVHGGAQAGRAQAEHEAGSGTCGRKPTRGRGDVSAREAAL